MSDNVFVHSRALVDEGVTIGPGSRIWAFAHLVTGATVGSDCNICDHTFIEGKVRIGSRATIKCGVYLWDGIELEDDVFVGPCVAFTNDRKPRSKRYPQEYLRTLLKEGCSIGANATILGGITVGRWAMVGAGSVVTHDVPDYGLVVGSPARFRSWICRCTQRLQFNESRANCSCGRSFEQQARDAVTEISGA